MPDAPADSSTSSSSSQPFAYATLVTSTSYLPGVFLLAHSLHQHSPHPLLVLYTPDKLPESSIFALRREADRSNLIPYPTTTLLPSFDKPRNLIAERFADTWTKLRVFELHHLGYERICYLDADMLVMKDPGDLFTMDLPSDGLLANGACVCNLDDDAWSPPSWKKENCIYTGMKHPDCLTSPRPVDSTDGPRETYRLLNSGMFVFHPSQQQWDAVLHMFNSKPDLMRTYDFPDQDFITDFFDGKWINVGYAYNAIKTARYWHPEMWDDDAIRVLHYIVDKPWSKRVGEDGVAGYRGDDGVTHQWWWTAYGQWEKEREGQGETAVLEEMRKYVAPPTGGGS